MYLLTTKAEQNQAIPAQHNQIQKQINVGSCRAQNRLRLGNILNTDHLIANMHFTLRPAEAGDEDFLHRLYASTRTDEMALVDWSAEQKEAFLCMQFQAQTAHYRAYYRHAEYQIIQHENIPIGRLIVDRSNDSMLVVDIALLPEYRNAGIGTTIIRHLMTEAALAYQPIVLRVEFFNRAIKLYSRLGFVKTREINIYHEMIWHPGSSHS
jgi:ribosomal protein S18 acetylase RimI-like enzyme